MKLTVDQALQKGVAAHKEGKLSEAERIYQAILRSKPLHPDANHNLGVLAVSVNKADTALQFFKIAVEANPKVEQFWLSYIGALIKNNQLEIAKAALEKGRERGISEERVSILESQLNALCLKSESNRSSRDQFFQAVELRESGKYQEAQNLLKKFIEVQPNEPEALSLLSQVLLLDQKDTEAEKTLLAALSLNPDLPSIYRNQARLLLKQSKPAEALKKAQSGYKRWPTDQENWIVLAACFQANQRDQEALLLVEKVLQANPRHAEASANRALIRWRAKDLSGAIEDAEVAVSLKPHLHQMWMVLGSLRRESNKLSGAIEAVRNACRIEPRNVEYMTNLAELLSQQNKAGEAIIILEEATKIAPELANVWMNLGILLGQTGRMEEALTVFQKSTQLAPQRAESHHNLGITLEKLGRLVEAEESFRNVIALKPDFIEAQSNLGNVLQQLGRLDEAVASCRQAIALKSDVAELHNNMGLLLKQIGRLDDAKTSLRQAIALKPDFAEAHENLANVFEQLGRLDEAVASCRQAIALRSNFVEAHNRLLKCLYLLDKKSCFFDELDCLINQGEVNSLIGSLSCRSVLKYGLERPNLFCKDPMKYVLHTNLNTQYDFEKVFAKRARAILSENNTKLKQPLVINGYQTYGNLFDIKSEHTEKIQKAIRLQVEKYRIRFKNSEEGLIKNWPTSYSLYGWIVSMKSGGKLRPHMHDKAWISGSIYINVPSKSKTDSGNLVVCIDDEESATASRNNPTESIDVVTESLVLFPASLMHYTIPFESEEERIVLAFDVIRK